MAVVAIAALAWLSTPPSSRSLRAPRLRVRLGARDRFLFRAAAWTVLVGNWVFLILQGR